MTQSVLERPQTEQQPVLKRSDLPANLDDFGAELDALRQSVLDDLGERDADYIHQVIKAQRALEVGADMVLMAKSGVDGVYSADPRTNPDAQRLEHLTYTEALHRNIRVMDQTAMTMCNDNGLNMRVFGMEGEGNVTRALLGEELGTLVTP